MKNKAKFIAIVSIVAAIIVLMLCAKTYFQCAFLKNGATINSDTIEGMKGMIKAAAFEIMPGVSLLLIINSIVLLACSRKLDK